MQIEYVDITDIAPYPYNPRDNELAIPQVAESIKNFGFLVPCVIDDNNVLITGHTRTEGAKLLGYTEVPCIRASHLTVDQINAFRLVDNKSGETATWDFDLLAGEIGKISGMGLDLTAFGWSQSEIDCLSEVISDACLQAPTVVADELLNGANSNTLRRSPTTARFVMGEIVFFIPATAYRSWAAGVRELCSYNEEEIANELKRRLGIVE